MIYKIFITYKGVPIYDENIISDFMPTKFDENMRRIVDVANEILDKNKYPDYKENIKASVMQVRPVEFHYKRDLPQLLVFSDDEANSPSPTGSQTDEAVKEILDITKGLRFDKKLDK